MDTFLANESPDLGPIDLDWTIAELVEWLSDDVRQHDAALHQPLTRIEAAVTGSRWGGTSSTIALIRSLVDAVRADPALRAVRIHDLDRQEPQDTSALPERIPQLA
ncbi:hypothetical protein KZC51_00755 [Microbacterium sp. SSW1-49]|uniref:Uncharacterized protein n=1 Tax=Microbacterium croceum TaxID=2851645 RepID=A0ABT0FA63_9MICO|nr:hypothetical protein [Microbacterium croceum]MCK2034651.1 hypothetical protein [Microbacterium croceum]